MVGSNSTTRSARTTSADRLRQGGRRLPESQHAVLRASRSTARAVPRGPTGPGLPQSELWKLNGAYPCQLDSAYDYRNPSWPIDLINTTQCNRRVWLYANLDKSGEKKCIPPGAARKITDQDLKLAMILRIGARGGCP